MRKIILQIIVVHIFTGCSSTDNSSRQIISTKSESKVVRQKFFDYDEIDYYFNDFDEAKLPDLSNNSTKSKLDSLKYGVILGEIPKNMEELSFIDKLEKLDYKKEIVDKSKFAKIDSVFIENL